MGLALLATWEGSRLVSYRDSAGYPTIGVGHLITDRDRLRWQHKRDGRGRYVLNESEVLTLLAEDVDKVERAIAKRKVGPWLNPNILDSLASFTFNLGTGLLDELWVKYLIEDEMIGLAEAHFPRYNRARGKVVRGLTIRRHEELAWMRKGAQSLPS